MLINALCDYYDDLERDGKLIPKGYSKQDVHYLICLKPDGVIDSIISAVDVGGDEQTSESPEVKNAKGKKSKRAQSITFPQRTQKSGIESNIIEHRPLYIFGLNLDGDTFTTEDKTGKAKKSNAAFKEVNLSFIEGLDSPIINAYRNFIQNWIPENETENPYLKGIGKAYKNSYFAFCLSGQPGVLLHEDPLIKAKWESLNTDEVSNDAVLAQCAVTGRKLPIAKLHKKIKGINGGQPSGTILVGFNETAYCSYGNDQSYNSNISEEIMNKYTFALNSLLADKKHFNLIDDITVIFWATGGKKNTECSDWANVLMFGGNDEIDDKKVDDMLKSILNSAEDSTVTEDKLSSLYKIDKNIDFYIVGLKPNASRVSQKFIYRRKFGQILACIAQHQKDMQIGDETRSVPLKEIKKVLKYPKSKNEKIDASLMSAIFKSIVFGTPYPDYLLSTVVRRMKTDKFDKKDEKKDKAWINRIRAGLVKACVNRWLRNNKNYNNKEELKLALDKENKNEAYLCGRLFAVLQRIQENAAAPAKLNRTIKDTYFASAASKPALVFPKLLALSQNHIKKIGEKLINGIPGEKLEIYFNKLVEEIIGKLGVGFPETLTLTEQGKFMIGYYHQDQDFYKKNETETEEEN